MPALIILTASIIQYSVPYCPEDNSLWIYTVLRSLVDGFRSA